MPLLPLAFPYFLTIQDTRNNDSRLDMRHHPRRLIDWRGEICHYLDLPQLSTDDEVLEALEKVSGQLQEAERLNSEVASRGPPRFQVINRIQCRNLGDGDGLYLDPPSLSQTGPRQAHLRGTNEIRNVKAYLKQHKEVVFLVYRHFECCGKLSEGRFHRHARQSAPANVSHLLTREFIEVISDSLRLALKKLSETALQGIRYPKFEAEGDDEEDTIPYPYLWWYYRRQEIDEARLQFDTVSRQMVDVFRNYFQNRLQDVWAKVDDLLSKGRMMAEYIEYLFVRPAKSWP
jgi:hypothetical protein